jgi:predicted branched-subunit amino acid permease
LRLKGLTIYAVSGGLVIVSAYYGVARSLGAHPFWDTQVALIGAPIGLVLAATLRALKWRWVTRLFAFLLLLTIAATAAHQGRLQFAASFAENALAGQFWYLGWIACAASAAGLIATVLTPRKSKLK